MAKILPEQILALLTNIEALYHRLIIVAAPTGTGKTKTLRSMEQQHNQMYYINLSLELSKYLLPLTMKQRALKAADAIDEIIHHPAATVTILDNIELLFDPTLQLRPLTLLQQFSRNKSLIVSWNGEVVNDHLIYAKPGHPEYQSEPTSGLLIVHS